MQIKKLLAFIRKNYLPLIFIGCTLFIALVVIYKVYVQKPTYVYVRVKVSQGFWWATTQKPNLWYVQAIRQAKTELDVSGKPIAEVLRVAYYPWYGSNQFDVYVTLKLKVNVEKNNTYTFKRETLSIGAPIELQFSNVAFSGTVTALSKKPFDLKLVTKTLYLTKKFVYPWEYDAITIGDYFNDGNSNVVEVVEKGKGETNELFVNELGKIISTETESYSYVFLKVKVRLRLQEGQLLYGEEIIVAPGRAFGFVTNSFTFNDYVVSHIE